MSTEDDLLSDDAPQDLGRQTFESAYIGKSGIKLRLTLSRTLWPAGWYDGEPAPFQSCLTSTQPASSGAGASEAAGHGARSHKRARASDDDGGYTSPMDAAGGDSRGTRASARIRAQSVSNAFGAGANAGAGAAPHPGGAGASGDGTDGRGMTRPSRSMSTSSSALFSVGYEDDEVVIIGGSSEAGSVTGPHGAGAASSGPPRKRSRTESSSSGHGKADTDGEAEALYAASVAIDLEQAPQRGNSWLTSSLIDAVLYRFARAYPGVHFLPCDFAAWDLIKAAKGGTPTLSTFQPLDMLRRPIIIEPDAIPPVHEPPSWYNPLPHSCPAPAPARAGKAQAAGEAQGASTSGSSAAAASAGASSSGAAASSAAGHVPRSGTAGAVAPARPPRYTALPAADWTKALKDGSAYTSILLATAIAHKGLGLSLPAFASAVRGSMDVLLGAGHTPPLPQNNVDGLVAVVHQAAPIAPTAAAGAAGAGAARGAAAPAAAWSSAAGPSARHLSSGAGAGAGAGSSSDTHAAGSTPWDNKLLSRKPAGVHYSAPRYASANKPIVFCWHERANHWITVVVHTGPVKRIEVYEPMGKPERGKGSGTSSSFGASSAGSRARAGAGASSSSASASSADASGPYEGAPSNQYKTVGLSLRSVPLQLLQWLDTVCPLPTDGGWRAKSVSAVTHAHQVNGFDCGPASMLYAEKVASGLSAHSICAYTDQAEISRYREHVLAYLHGLAKSVH